MKFMHKLSRLSEGIRTCDVPTNKLKIGKDTFVGFDSLLSELFRYCSFSSVKLSLKGVENLDLRSTFDSKKSSNHPYIFVSLYVSVSGVVVRDTQNDKRLDYKV